MIAVTDNKPIYDHAHGDGVTVKDKRIAIDMIIVRNDLKNQKITLRWVDTRQMIVDSMTKMNCKPDFLLFVLRCGRYVCVEEDVSLQIKAQEREVRKTLNASKKGV